MDVILLNMAVDGTRAGDKVIFNGCLIVVPDVAVISSPGEKIVSVQGSGAPQGDNAVRGLKSLGCRELTYKLCYLGNSTQVRRKAFYFLLTLSPHHTPPLQNPLVFYLSWARLISSFHLSLSLSCCLCRPAASREAGGDDQHPR
jgi:hypothetical protein